MKRNYFTVALFISMLFVTSSIYPAEQTKATTSSMGDYVIGPGDMLDISVWDHEALTRVVTVLPDGKIHFPLIGEVKVGGKTLLALEKELKEKITPFVSNPELSVMVNQVNCMLIYVIGEVQKPGMFHLNNHVSVLQALAMAGGFNTWAKQNKIEIYRESENKTEVLKISYDEITKMKKLDQNIKLRRGDVVVVP